MGSGVSTMAKTKAKTLHPMMDRKLQASIAHHEGFGSVHRRHHLQEAASALERTEIQLADKSKVLAMQTTELRNVQVRFASLRTRSILGSDPIRTHERFEARRADSTQRNAATSGARENHPRQA
jgi:hypothetical protein